MRIGPSQFRLLAAGLDSLRLTLPQFRRLIVYVYDFTAAGLSLVIAYFLRLGYEQPERLKDLPELVALFVLICMVTFPIARLNSGSWRYASLRDMIAIFKAVTASVLIFTLVLFLWERAASLPRTVLIIEWFVLAVMLGGPRLAYRIYRESRLGRSPTASDGAHGLRILLFGYCDEADTFIRTVRRDTRSRYALVGIFESNPRHVGRQLHGVPVLGLLDSLPQFVEEARERGMAPERIIVAPSSIDRAQLGEIVAVASKAGLGVDRLPNIQRLASMDEEGLKPQAVRLEDLLGREAVAVDEQGINRLISGRRILITGAGGSVGSELARQVLRFGAARITLVENGEYNLYDIDRRLRHDAAQTELRPILCDIRDRERMMRLMDRERPELVFHAAALKHVPIAEHNPVEAVLTNVFGVKNAADAAAAAGAGAFIMISTDKAVNPTSILGLTKSLSEAYCQLLDAGGSATRFINVRFGNVLGSRGSVVPLFEEQLKQGGPLTLTHPDVTRYIMTSSEAAQLVLQASAYGLRQRHRGGGIYVLDMGQPVKIVELARTMIRLAGLDPDEDVKIQFTGLRPGEKLAEELFSEDETVETTPVDGVLLASPRPVGGEAIDRLMMELQEAVQADDRQRTARLLRDGMPGIRQQAEVVPLRRPDANRVAAVGDPS